MNARADLLQLVRTSTTESLPADYVELTARRLGIATAGVGLVDLIYLVLYRTVWAADSTLVGTSAGIAGSLVSIVIAAYVFRRVRPVRHVVWVAVSYEIFLALNLALSESWAVSYQTTSAQVPWGVVVIVWFPFLIPARPQIVLLSSLAAAAMTPLALAIRCSLGGHAWPDGAVISSYVLPPFLCALLAWAPTSTLYRLVRQFSARAGSATTNCPSDSDEAAWAKSGARTTDCYRRIASGGRARRSRCVTRWQQFTCRTPGRGNERRPGGARICRS